MAQGPESPVYTRASQGLRSSTTNTPLSPPLLFHLNMMLNMIKCLVFPANMSAVNSFVGRHIHLIVNLST